MRLCSMSGRVGLEWETEDASAHCTQRSGGLDNWGTGEEPVFLPGRGRGRWASHSWG